MHACSHAAQRFKEYRHAAARSCSSRSTSANVASCDPIWRLHGDSSLSARRPHTARIPPKLRQHYSGEWSACANEIDLLGFLSWLAKMDSSRENPGACLAACCSLLVVASALRSISREEEEEEVLTK